MANTKLFKQNPGQPQVSADSRSAPPPSVLAPVPELLTPGSLIPMLVLLIVVGVWGLISGHATIKGNEMSKYQAIFSATNAATLTGFQQAHNPNDYTVFGQIITLMMMLGGIFFSFIAGGLGVVRIARLRFGHWQVVRWAIASTMMVAIVGGVLLRGVDDPDSDAGRSFFQASYQAISAFGNCGLFIGSLPSASGARVQLIVLPLALLGGFGLPVLMEIVDWLRGDRPLSRHSRTVLIWSAGAYAVIAVVLFLFTMPVVHADLATWQRAIAGASREAINARSAGFSFQSASYLPQAAGALMILVMIVGAAPGGTAGGLKLTTLAVMNGGVRDLLARRSTGRPLGLALLWTVIYLTMVLIPGVVLLITEPGFHLDRTLFLAASALGNVGLSHDPIVVSDAGLCVLSITMLLGRVAPVLMLWHVADTTPEADVAVG